MTPPAQRCCARGDGSSSAERLLHLAVDFREGLYRAFSDVTQGRQPSKCDLDVINGLLARTPITLQIGAEGERLVCFRTGSMLDEARLLGPVAWSAAELLGSSKSLSKVRQCAGEECGGCFSISRRAYPAVLTWMIAAAERKRSATIDGKCKMSQDPAGEGCPGGLGNI